VESFIEITDSVCVAQKNSCGSDERVILFLKLSPGAQFDEGLVSRLKKSIREQLSPRHVPAVILPITDIPVSVVLKKILFLFSSKGSNGLKIFLFCFQYTISGKKVEIAVRNVIEGEDVKNKGALANPHSLDLYKNIPQLASWS